MRTVFFWSILMLGSILLVWCGSPLQDIYTRLDTYIADSSFTEAEKLLNETFVHYPQDSVLLSKKATLLIKTEQYDEYLDLRPQLDPSQQKKQQRDHLIAQIRAGETMQALTTLEQLLNNKKTSDLYQLQGQAYYVQWLFPEAIDAYDRALQKDATNQEALVNKAIALADNGDLYASLDLLDQGLQQYPDNYLMWYNKGTVLSDLGYQQRNVLGTWAFSYYGDALRHFQHSYKLNPKHLNTIIRLGITYLDLAQYPKAHQAFDVALSVNPHAYDAWYYKAKTYTAQGELSKAKETYKTLLEANPSYEAAQQELILLEKQE